MCDTDLPLWLMYCTVFIYIVQPHTTASSDGLLVIDIWDVAGFANSVPGRILGCVSVFSKCSLQGGFEGIDLVSHRGPPFK